MMNPKQRCGVTLPTPGRGFRLMEPFGPLELS